MATQTTPTPSAMDTDPFVTAYPEMRPFWDGTAAGRLLLHTCTRCERPHWTPRMVCPFCGSQNLAWRQASGDGLVHAYTVMRRVAQLYAMAYVELAEGVLVLSNIVDVDVNAISIGQPVRAVFRQAEGGRWAPFFTPAISGAV